MIKVLNRGLYSSIQDLGRFGYQEFGVPYSGAMDVQALKLVNLILGNVENAAVLEMTMLGAKLQFQCDTIICIAGADMQAKLNGHPVSNYMLIAVKASDVLNFSSARGGCRTYLGVKSGFQTEKVMSSRSMYQDITQNIVIQEGDLIAVEACSGEPSAKHASLKINTDYTTFSTLDVYKGPEFNALTKKQQEVLWSKPFSISKNNNRMAYQLEEPFENNLSPIITSPVTPGTVQLTPSGKLIILMRDCQTTGGYPRVLQLKGASLNSLAQKFTGQSIRFECVDML